MPVARCNRVTQCSPRALQHARMLQITLAPAPVACRIFGQRRRAFFVRAASASASSRTAQPARRISAASTKSWLRICPPIGRGPLKAGRSGGLRERARADVSRCGPSNCCPLRATRRAHRRSAAHRACRRIAAVRANGVTALTITGNVWIRPTPALLLHRGDQAHQRVAGHQRVGIEHDHGGRSNGRRSAAAIRRYCRPSSRALFARCRRKMRFSPPSRGAQGREMPPPRR